MDTTRFVHERIVHERIRTVQPELAACIARLKTLSAQCGGSDVLAPFNASPSTLAERRSALLEQLVAVESLCRARDAVAPDDAVRGARARAAVRRELALVDSNVRRFVSEVRVSRRHHSA